MGGSSAKICVAGPNGAVQRVVTVPHDESRTVPETLRAWLAVLSENPFEAIGLGLPGHICDEGSLLRQSNTAFLDEFPLRDWLENETGLPVILENDATVAAYAEARLGPAPAERFLMVTLGTGVGVAFLENGRPFFTINRTLGDIGHIVVAHGHNATCQMGCHGCLESVASVQSLARMAHADRFDFSHADIGRTHVWAFRDSEAEARSASGARI